jgi:hypothetical protein
MSALGVSGLRLLKARLDLRISALAGGVRIWPLGKGGFARNGLAQPDCRRVAIKGKFNRHILVFGGSGK